MHSLRFHEVLHQLNAICRWINKPSGDQTRSEEAIYFLLAIWFHLLRYEGKTTGHLFPVGFVLVCSKEFSFKKKVKINAFFQA